MANAAGIAATEKGALAASIDAMALTDGERHVSVNQPYADLYGFGEPADLADEPWDRRFAADERGRLEREILPACRADGRWRGYVTGRHRDGSALPVELSLAGLDDGGFVCVCRGRDADGRGLKRQRDELETLSRINDLLLRIARDLFESPTRTEIERTVCERLAASDLYQFAWIGDPDAEGRRIVPRVSAGIDEGYVDALTVTTTDTDTGRGPAGRAFRTGEVQVSQDVRTDPTFEPWRAEALERGVESAAAVPLVHGDTTYGILAVYATRPFAFSRRERTGFETLGKAAGFATNAVENRELLFADTVVQLEFEVTDPELVFVRVTEQLSCELTLTGSVESASGDWRVYLAVDGAEPSAVRDAAATDPDVDRVRTLVNDGDAALVEFVMLRSPLCEQADFGAILTSAHVDDGRGRFCIEAPRSADVRQLAERFRAAYSGSTLVAQREFDRPVRTAGEVRESIGDRLTDRQREALARAYHAGYFEWPRLSTAGDIASSMDIAETTFHYHLRHALETLSATLVDLGER